MLLRASVTLLSRCRIGHGSVLCQVARKELHIPKLNLPHSISAHRSALHTSSRFNRGFISRMKIYFSFAIGTATVSYLGHPYFGKLISERSSKINEYFGWWHSKPDAYKVYWLICGTCILICLAFNVSNRLQLEKTYKFLRKHFVAAPGHPVTSLILSAFTHLSPLHLFVNMYIFHNLTNHLLPEIGKEKFLGCFLFSAALSGCASVSLQAYRCLNHGAVGASGAVLGLLAMVMYTHPEYTFHIIFLPFMQIPASALFASMLTVDAIGIIRGWKYLDHAGHLGGLLSGLIWTLLTNAKGNLLEKKDKPKSALSEENEPWGA